MLGSKKLGEVTDRAKAEISRASTAVQAALGMAVLALVVAGVALAVVSALVIGGTRVA